MCDDNTDMHRCSRDCLEAQLFFYYYELQGGEIGVGVSDFLCCCVLLSVVSLARGIEADIYIRVGLDVLETHVFYLFID